MGADRDVLHALAMAGIAAPAAVAETVGEPPEAVSTALSDLAEAGLVEGADGVWYVTDEGDERLTALCRERFDGDGIAALRERHEAFEALDARVKELAAEWQETGDAALVDDLAGVHAELEALLDGLEGAVAEAYEPYRRDLAAALAELRDGEAAYFTGTDVDSYHEVWFRLHDDLLRTLGAGRHA